MITRIIYEAMNCYVSTQINVKIITDLCRIITRLNYYSFRSFLVLLDDWLVNRGLFRFFYDWCLNLFANDMPCIRRLYCNTIMGLAVVLKLFPFLHFLLLIFPSFGRHGVSTRDCGKKNLCTDIVISDDFNPLYIHSGFPPALEKWNNFFPVREKSGNFEKMSKSLGKLWFIN